MKTELRSVQIPELRVLDVNGEPQVNCRAILFNSWSCDLGGFVERMMPGSVELDNDLPALFAHDTSMVLGRTSAGTMTVAQDAAGVSFNATPPDTTWARDMLVSMRRGDIKGCSYRMVPLEDKWYMSDGRVCRDITRAQVSELTITSMPAYPETTAEARSKAQEIRAMVFADTLVDMDADRLASFSRLFTLEYALEDSITDSLLSGDQAAAETAIDDFATECKSWLSDHVTRFATWYPSLEVIEAARALARGEMRTKDIGEAAGAAVDSSDTGGAPEAREVFIPHIGFKRMKGHDNVS